MKRPDSTWAEFVSTQNVARVLQHLLNKQYIPSVVSLKRAIRELGIKRTDGKTSADDVQEARVRLKPTSTPLCWASAAFCFYNSGRERW